MSKPQPFTKDDRSAASYASMELMGASSSLHMPAEPILPTDPDYRESGDYLTDTDRMVRHAQQHLTAAMLAVSAERHFMEVIEIELRMARATGEALTLLRFNELRYEIYALYAEKPENQRRMHDAANPSR